MSKRLLCSILILSMFIVTMTWVPAVPIINNMNSDINIQDGSSQDVGDNNEFTPIEDTTPNNNNLFSLAYDESVDGVLNPVLVEQSGYIASENISARTDSYQNLEYELPLDVDHNWKADLTDVSVWNLEKLYAVNGSFNEGNPGLNQFPDGSVDYHPLGWDANSTDTGTYETDVQSAGYDSSSRKFVILENQGAKVGPNPNIFGHAAGTRVVWTQSIQNAPYTENFILNFDYFYLRGPLDGVNGTSSITGNCSIALFINGANIWNMSLLLLTQRGVWLDTGDIPITVAGLPSNFLFEIGLVVDETMVLNAANDYDGDSQNLADGLANTVYITVYLDDVSFIKATPPTAAQVDLKFTTGGLFSPLTGSMGTYSASIENSSYWTTPIVPVALTSNTSVSFGYKTRLYSHRFTDSNWRNDISSFGVTYTIDHSLSADLSFYTYVGYLGEYENPEMTIIFPNDWENVTVSDPFLTDLTATCDIGSDYLTVPTSIIDRLGWWEVKLHSPNYAKSIISQIDDGVWSETGIFRIGNTTRADITIGTETDVPASLTGVNVTWFNPSDEIWASDPLLTGVSGQVYSTSQTFLSGSSPAGEWWVEVYWTNGTEVAYDRARFEVHHTANLVADPTEISTDTGLTIKGLVRYTDGDTNTPILDASATLLANWSGSIIPFVANPVQNWWEADFDTSITGAGDFIIVVNASRDYYDNVSCQILVHSVRVTRLSSPNSPWTAAEWGEVVSLTLKFESYDYSTETWSPVINETDTRASVNWTYNSWDVYPDITPGIYIMNLNTSANNVGTWLLEISFNKTNHQSKIMLITIIVSPTTSSLSIIEGVSDEVDIDEPRSLTLRFLDFENDPISGANVVVDSVSPSSGLEYTTITEIIGESGSYNVTLKPHEAGVFTIRFVASKQNSENATTVFVLVVKDVVTQLIIPGTGSVEIGLTDVYNTTFRFELLNGTGIENALINFTYTGGNESDLTITWAEYNSGDYSLEVNPSSSGTFLITIAASKPYYQSASDSFFLSVRGITTTLTCYNGTADLVSFGKDYNLVVSYTNGTGHGLVGANVSIVNVVSDSILTWDETIPGSPGFYTILLTPHAADTFTILVRAELPNHVSQDVPFTLTATAIATSLAVLNVSTVISRDQNFTVYLLFQDEDLNGLENTTITVPNPPVGVSLTLFEELTDGMYRVTIAPLEIGTFDIIFKASKDGYQNGYATFTLGAIRVPTSLRTSSGLISHTMIYSEQYELLLFYERTGPSLNVSGATIDIQASDSGISWSYQEETNGYLLTVNPEKSGLWYLQISAQLEGYSSSYIEFELRVNPIPVEVTLLSEGSALEGSRFEIRIGLTRNGTSIPITKATVEYRLSLHRTGDFIQMEELDSEPGVYTATDSFPLFVEDSEYRLEIRISKAYHQLVQPVDVPFFKEVSIPQRMGPLIVGGSGIGIVLVAMMIGLRISSRRKKAQIECDISNKRRFDDADNIIGIIVMHKKSGIPIYSKIVKGGFEEGIVAAFISAVTHFREEFEMFDEEAMTVIPISDIIRAVQTRNLICAFITVRSASIEHNRKMESYGMQVGTYLDDIFDDVPPSSILDEKVTGMLDYIYETTMDGFLVRFYKSATSDRFPKRYQYIEQLLDELETRHCSKPIYLAQGVSTFGVSEARGCTLVLEAIEKKLLVQCEEHEPTVEDMDFAEFFAKGSNKD